MNTHYNMATKADRMCTNSSKVQSADKALSNLGWTFVPQGLASIFGAVSVRDYGFTSGWFRVSCCNAFIPIDLIDTFRYILYIMLMECQWEVVFFRRIMQNQLPELQSNFVEQWIPHNLPSYHRHWWRRRCLCLVRYFHALRQGVWGVLFYDSNDIINTCVTLIDRLRNDTVLRAKNKG